MAIESIAAAPIKAPVVLHAVDVDIVPSVGFVSKAVVAAVVVPYARFAIVAIVPTAINLFADSMRHIRLGVGATW